MTLRLRIPERFTLLGREWTVERPEIVDPDDEKAGAMCYGRDRRIAVMAEADGEKALELFAHEFTHAGLWRSGLSDAMSERIAYGMEQVMVDFIRAVVEEG